MRSLLLVLDGVGIGGAPDAAAYGDEGADTLGHVLQSARGVRLPTMWSLGLGSLLAGSPEARGSSRGASGRMRERSAGKDSTTGHWELAGVLLEDPFAVFNRFPEELVRAITGECGVRFLGNTRASGTAVLEELGPEHLRTGALILYTSADSVLQIAAHTDVMSVERLYAVCRVARRHASRWRIGRVIARPFRGVPGSFVRTGDRHDWSLPPPPNVLDLFAQHRVSTYGVGKTADLFAGRGFSGAHPTASNREGMQRTGEIWSDLRDGFVFTNLVDFDTMFGHRRDVTGFAQALEEFDRWLGGFLETCDGDDLIIITADHGNDPTFKGTDHTREDVPLLVVHGGASGDLGVRRTFADVAASLARFFGLPAWPVGEPFLTNGSEASRAALADRSTQP